MSASVTCGRDPQRYAAPAMVSRARSPIQDCGLVDTGIEASKITPCGSSPPFSAHPPLRTATSRRSMRHRQALAPTVPQVGRHWLARADPYTIRAVVAMSAHVAAASIRVVSAPSDRRAACSRPRDIKRPHL